MSAETAVRCRGLRKSYGRGEARVEALRGADLDVRRGEVLLLVGPSGCGKTTLLSIIAALLDADDGECVVLGRDVRRMGEPDRARFRRHALGFVFQSANLLPALSAAENVAVPLLLAGLERAEALQRAVRVLATVGLADRAEAPPSQLSGGQRQRVAIARALVHAPDLVACDEPTSQLDATSGRAVMELLHDVVRTPERALIVVTHDTRTLEFADRVARMEDGRIAGVERPR